VSEDARGRDQATPEKAVETVIVVTTSFRVAELERA
jgi:hypothetical protein